MWAIAWEVVSGGAKAVFGFFAKVVLDPTLRTIAIVLVALAVIWFMHRDTVKARADLDAYKVSAMYAFGVEHGAFLRERGLYLSVKTNRSADIAIALDDASNTAKTCEARVAETRRSDNAINDLINKAVPHDPKVSSAPGRRLYDDGELCHAIGVACAG